MCAGHKSYVLIWDRSHCDLILLLKETLKKNEISTLYTRLLNGATSVGVGWLAQPAQHLLAPPASSILFPSVVCFGEADTSQCRKPPPPSRLVKGPCRRRR